MKSNDSKPLRTDEEKQTQPLPGEVDPEHALFQAITTAAVEWSKIKAKVPPTSLVNPPPRK